MRIVISVFFLVLAYANLANSEDNWNVPISYQLRVFPNVPQYSEQHYNNGSFTLKPKYSTALFKDYDFEFEPYYRWDERDENRTHGDIRELSLTVPLSSHLLTVGIDKVFWGVTETQHLVDIINQQDLVDSFDANEKLGQPMVRYEFSLWGQWQLFALVGFRERTFPSIVGRPRTPLVVDTEVSERVRNEDIDYAARWSQTFGKLDISLSHFFGNAREPVLDPDLANLRLVPIYDEIDQSGVEIQYAVESLILKSEAIYRSGTMPTNNFFAYTVGGEYNYGDITGILEYSYDDRGKVGTVLFQDDYFVGFRWNLNDAFESNIFFGFNIDDETDANMLTLRYQRRLTDSLTLNLKTLTFSNVPDPQLDPLMSVQNDSFFEIALTQYFLF